MEEIDIGRLRQDVMRYYEDIGDLEMDEYGTAMGFFPTATVDLIQAESRKNSNIANVSSASDEELIQIATALGFDVDDYKVRGMRF